MLVAVVVVVVARIIVVVVVVVVAKIISILVTVGRCGDYLDTSSGSSSRNYSREISCSESVLWTTNCPLVLACNGLGDGGHFLRSLYTFRIQSVFLLFIKYTHDYPHAEGKELSLGRSLVSSGTAACVCCLISSNFRFFLFLAVFFG